MTISGENPFRRAVGGGLRAALSLTLAAIVRLKRQGHRVPFAPGGLGALADQERKRTLTEPKAAATR